MRNGDRSHRTQLFSPLGTETRVPQTSRGVTACLSTAGTRTQWTASLLHISALHLTQTHACSPFSFLLENFNWGSERSQLIFPNRKTHKLEWVWVNIHLNPHPICLKSNEKNRSWGPRRRTQGLGHSQLSPEGSRVLCRRPGSTHRFQRTSLSPLIRVCPQMAS